MPAHFFFLLLPSIFLSTNQPTHHQPTNQPTDTTNHPQTTSKAIKQVDLSVERYLLPNNNHATTTTTTTHTTFNHGPGNVSRQIRQSRGCHSRYRYASSSSLLFHFSNCSPLSLSSFSLPLFVSPADPPIPEVKRPNSTPRLCMIQRIDPDFNDQYDIFF